jgi:DNA-binding MarR family transcriptional regulator
MSGTLDKELEVLETIHSAGENNLPVVQRDIAHIIGASLGMTNAIIKRLVKKGFLIMKKVNNRNIHYVVSPAGMRAITERSYRYFKRTIRNVVYYKERIETLISDSRAEGVDETVLVGESDLEFIVEHFCMKYDLGFFRMNSDALLEEPLGENSLYQDRQLERGSGRLYILSESLDISVSESILKNAAPERVHGTGTIRIKHLRELIENR